MKVSCRIILLVQPSLGEWMFSKAIDMIKKEICLEIEKQYEVHFPEIGTDKDNIHLLIHSIPK